jgi:hypothetical protein
LTSVELSEKATTSPTTASTPKVFALTRYRLAEGWLVVDSHPCDYGVTIAGLRSPRPSPPRARHHEIAGPEQIAERGHAEPEQHRHRDGLSEGYSWWC